MPRLAPTTRTVRGDGLIRASLAPGSRRARDDLAGASARAGRHRLGRRRRGRAVGDGVREQLAQALLRPGVAAAVGVALLEIGRRLGLWPGGHALDPVEA